MKAVDMNAVRIHQYQLSLEETSLDEDRLALLKRKGQNRLQVVQRHGSRFIRSYMDRDALARCVILALLRHILLEDQSKLALLKKMVYQSQLPRLTSSHGIQLSHLHFNFCKKLKQLQEAPTEEIIIKAFNTCPFFDEVLLWTVKEQYASRGIWDTLQGDAYAAIGRDFGVVITDRYSQQNSFLWVQREIDDWLVPSVIELSLRSNETLSLSSGSSAKGQFLTVSVTTPSEFKLSQDKQNCDPNIRKASKIVKEFELTEKGSERSRRGGLWGWLCCGE